MATRLAADIEPIPGYRLIDRLGRGGFGEVWKCEAPGGMLKAIKFVYGNLDEATENGKPAEQELKALNRVKSIRHPYILSLERYDIIEGQLVIVMELADRNLFDRFRECQEQGLQGIPREELLQYMEESAEALDLMNSQFQLQHLDIKPQNIFLVFNHIKVADFGLAKDLEGMQATLTGGVTPVYAAPETFECRVTRYCDQYSLGIVYQELLTGQRPFNGTTARQLMMQHIQSAPDLSSLPAHDRPIIARALSKQPDQRYGTCAELVQALMSAGETTVVSDHTPLPMIVPANRPSGNGTAVATRLSATGVAARPSGLPSLSANQKLPPLLNQRAAANAALANARHAPPEQTGPGVLFPGLVIGLGQFGLLVLQRLRRTLRDRFGSASLPHLRMLYLDTEPETLQSLSSSSSAVDSSEVYVARLNRPTHYNQARPDLPPVGNWLNPQMLYRIPRQPATAGMRAFGRLALCDHYRAIMAKVRGDLEACLDHAALTEAGEMTRLQLRTNRPRVYVITSLMGGTGSGMFIDLAYAVRMQLRVLGYKQPEVHALLFAPQVDRETPRSQAVANSYAALTELFHYNAGKTQYDALFDTKDGPIVDNERPFKRCLMLQLPVTAEPSALRPVLGTAAGFLFQEMFTPLGRDGDRARGDSSKVALQTCGTFRLTWPRRALLERAARRACARVINGWAISDAQHLTAPVADWVAEQWPRLQVDADSTLTRLRDAFRAGAEADPALELSTVVDALDAKDQHAKVELSDLCQALEKITQLVGQPEVDMWAGGGRLSQLLENAARSIGGETDKRLAAFALSVVEHTGWRLAGAEEVIKQSTARLKQSLEPLEQQLPKLHQASREVYVKAFNSLKSLEGMSRGSRWGSVVRSTLAHMREYGQKRFEFLTQRALVIAHRIIATFGQDGQRDVKFLRSRLEAMEHLLLRPSSGSGLGFMGPERPILPPGCKDADEAAERMTAAVRPEELASLEEVLLTFIRKKCRSFAEFAREHTDQSRGMAGALVEQARDFIEPRLQSMNPAAVLFATGDPATAGQEALSAYERAKPAIGAARELCLLAVPVGAEGAQFATVAHESLKGAAIVTVTGTDDIIFHREAQNLGPSDLPQLGPTAREAFQHISNSDQVAPHTRCDVTWQAIAK